MFDVIIGNRTWCGMRIAKGKEIRGGIGERMGNSEGRKEIGNGEEWKWEGGRSEKSKWEGQETENRMD